MKKELTQQIARIRTHYGLSLAQFGSLVGAPAASVKRWEAGVAPREKFFFQIYLVVGLIQSPDDVFFDLNRQGISLNRTHWDTFASLVKGAHSSLEVADEIGIEKLEVAQTIVTGVQGLLTLIAGAFAARSRLGEKASTALATRIATFLQ